MFFRALAVVAVGAVVSMAASKAQFSGYVENTTSVLGDPSVTVSDIATARFEAAWEHESRGGIETHLLVNAALSPLDPFASVREHSVMRRVMATVVDPMAALADTVAAQLMPALFAELDSATAQALSDIAADGDIEDLMRYLPYSTMYPRDKVVLDRAVVKLFFKPFDLYVGRQMIGWGTGYAWNPTDVWNAKNPADPEAPKLGVNAIRAEIPLGAAAGVSVVVSPSADFEHVSGGVRVKGNIGRFDLSGSLMRILTADHTLLQLPSRVMVGADMAGELGDFGVWGEGVLVNPVYIDGDYTDFDSLYGQLDLGCNYTFDNGLYFMIEYLYNGLGTERCRDYDVYDFLHMTAGDMPGFGQHYAMIGATKDIGTDVTVGLYALGNLTDKSTLLLPSVEYRFHPSISMLLKAAISRGDREESEYGGLYHSGQLTITGWF